ncbi:MAG: CDP-alcohol phosphatidyltransferase family protein [Armatimonadota bacterium]
MQFKDVPNAICLLRIGLIPLLGLLAIYEARVAFVILLAFTWFTDAVDGYLARTYHLESKLGAQLDSIADNAVQLSMPFWLWFLAPDVYRRFWPLVLIILALFILSMLMQISRKAPMHTYANKITASLLAAFLLYTFAVGLNVAFMWITFLALAYAMVESIIILGSPYEVSEDTKSWWDLQRMDER